jgi:hypothetical protein
MENLILGHLNSPEQAAAHAADFSVITAYARALNPQGVGRESDIEKGQEILSTKGQSIEAHDAVIGQWLKELDQIERASIDARNGLIGQFRQSSGLPPVPGAGKGAAAPAAAAAPKEGDTGTSKSGKPLIFRGGHWEYGDAGPR